MHPFYCQIKQAWPEIKQQGLGGNEGLGCWLGVHQAAGGGVVTVDVST